MSARSKAKSRSSKNTRSARTQSTSPTFTSHSSREDVNGASPGKNDQYRLFFKKARDAIFVADSKTRRLVDVNLAAVRLMGYSRARLLTMKADELHPQEVLKETMEGFKSHAQGSADEVESLVLTSRGKKIPVAIRTSAIHVNGTPHLLGIFRNMSERKMAEEKLRQSDKRSKALSKASMTLLRITDPVKRYNYMLDHAREITESRYGFLGYIDPETGHLISPTLTKDVWDECQMVHKNVEFVTFTGLWGWVLTHKKNLLCNEPGKDPRSSSVPEGHVKIENFLGVPCLHKGRVAGMLALANKDGGFTKEDQALISEYSQLVTVAILDHRQVVEKERVQEKLRKSQKLQTDLLKISRKLPSCTVISEAWDASARPIVKTIGALGASLFMPDPDKTQIRLIGQYGLPGDYRCQINENMPLPTPEETVIEEACLSKKPAFTRDTETDPRFAKWKDLARAGGYRSMIALPIILECECLGGAVFYYEHPQDFTREEIDLVQLSVNQLTPALVRIKYDQVVRASEERFRTLYENSPVMIGGFDARGKLILWNNELERSLGWTKSEAMACENILALCYPDAQLYQEITEIIHRSDGIFRAHPIHAKDGSERIHRWANFPLPDGSIISTGYDITEEKKAEDALRESEERFRFITEVTSDFIYKVRVDDDAKMQVEWITDGFPRITGYVLEDMQTPDLWEKVIHAEDLPVLMGYFQTILSNKASQCVIRLVTKKNETLWLQIRGRPLADSKKDRVIGVLGGVSNITERKRAEIEIRERATLAEVGADIGAVLSMTKSFRESLHLCAEVFVERMGVAFARIWTLNRQDGVLELEASAGMYTHLDGAHGRIPLESPLKIAGIAREGEPKLINQVIGDPSVTDQDWAKRKGMIAFAGHPLVVEGRVVGVMGMFARHPLSDMTLKALASVAYEIAIGIDRKKNEEALRESEEKYRTIFESSPLGIVHYDQEAVVTACNDQFVALLASTMEKLIGLNALKALEDDQMKAAIAATLSGERGYFEGDYRSITGGKETVVKAELSPVHGEDGSLLGGMGIFEDISKRKRAEEALLDSERSYRTLASNLPAMVYRIHLREQNRIQFFNDMCLTMTGYHQEELIVGEICSLESMIHPEDRPLVVKTVQKSIAGKKLFSVEYRLKHKDGQWRYFMEKGVPIHDHQGNPLFIDGLIYDLTERRQLENELSRAQKLEAAGRVAGQIAHDFNNLLSPLMAYPDLMRMECSEDDRMLPLLDQMQSVATQMSEINQQLLTLGRRGHYNLETIDLNQLLDKVLSGFSFPNTVVLDNKFEGDLLPIEAGAAQLTRVFMNLIHNSLEAMNDIGKLTIATENVYLDKPLRGYETIRMGEFVRVMIRDTGCGMEEDALERIFEPFYTTKRADKKRGSGLGLSVVRTVIEDHKGYVGLESRPGQGTTFSLYFPITRNEICRKETFDHAIPRGHENILVVDDDPIQREVLTNLLTQLGYRTHSVESGESAVQYVKDHPQDLLVLDMVMGGMDGTETFRRVREICPEQKAFILSGYAESERVDEALRAGAGNYLRKPIGLKTLARAVRQELDET